MDGMPPDEVVRRGNSLVPEGWVLLPHLSVRELPVPLWRSSPTHAPRPSVRRSGPDASSREPGHRVRRTVATPPGPLASSGRRVDPVWVPDADHEAMRDLIRLRSRRATSGDASAPTSSRISAPSRALA